MKALLTMFATLLLISEFVATSAQRACRMENWESYEQYITEEFDTDLLLEERESFNVAFVNVKYQYEDAVRGIFSRIKTNSSGQWISFYVKAGSGDALDFQRQRSSDFFPEFRCRDGSIVKGASMVVVYRESNNRAPEFSENGYNFQITRPWSSQIPITVYNAILVRDFDFSSQNAQVNISVGRPDLVTVTQTALGYPYPADVPYSSDYCND